MPKVTERIISVNDYGTTKEVTMEWSDGQSWTGIIVDDVIPDDHRHIDWAAVLGVDLSGEVHTHTSRFVKYMSEDGHVVGSGWVVDDIDWSKAMGASFALVDKLKPAK